MSSLNIRRKMFHSLAFIFAFVYVWMGWLPAAVLSISTLVLFSIMEIWRLRDPDFPLNIITRKLVKPEEQIRVAGYFYFVLAATILIFLFPSSTVVTSIVVAGVADAAAALVGIKWGKHLFVARKRIKTLEGLAGGGVAAFLLTLALLYYFGGFYPLTSLIVAAVFVVLDYLTPPIDDNLLNPISIAVTLTLCRLILQI
ncbi:MAG: hypothetical protein KIH08_14435 [Candidatus Freyarchaeota archaeon]|nr:hypothetical protein [Candidatus Jordarchaeia archaeon]MBS7269283.1 hypothetical protein [Candidatus Jordarchaeia archaeon]MBS7280100.1 hypothetical protein [Candidatus Jordarchaeia archaeon]